MIISNDSFTDEEKRLFEFVLTQDFENKDRTIDYLNSLSAENIVRDYSPFYRIIEFRTSSIKDGYMGMSVIVSVLTVRESGKESTSFTLYSKDSFPFEYEIYNTDSSAIDIDEISGGEVLVV